MKKRILIVEDDVPFATSLRHNLVFEGYIVECVTTGDEAIAAVKKLAPDLVVLDIMLPGASGFDVCGVLRQGGHTPIIMLTARSQRADRVRGLNLGADDYIVKPFDLEEFLARVGAVLRRTRPEVERLVLGNVTIDFLGRKAKKGRDVVHLTHKEYELLQYLAQRPGRVVYRNELLCAVWGYPESLVTRSIDHAIVRLRKKIEPDFHNPRFIQTAHGDGYRLTP